MAWKDGPDYHLNHIHAYHEMTTLPPARRPHSLRAVKAQTARITALLDLLLLRRP